MLDFQKYVKICEVCGIYSLKYIQEFYTPVSLFGEKQN